MQTHNRWSLALLAVAGLGTLHSCAGGGTHSVEGNVTVAITDGAADEIESFTVDVTGLQLTTAIGSSVSVVSAPTRIDLASLSDLSQIISHATVPTGSYTQATITLDFTNASCMLVGQATAATLLDASSAPLTGQLVLPMQFGDGGVTVLASAHCVVEYDFDLNQSVTVDAIGNSVTVEPTFVVRVDRADPKPFIALGALESVFLPTNSFIAELQSIAGTTLARATFATTSTTVFQIDGVPMTGASGLAALAAMPVDTWIQAYGAADALAPRINAVYVEAGAGTYNGGQDIVEGYVVDRVGAAGMDATLTVLGHSNDALHTTFQFNTAFTVTASFANTKVLSHGSSTAGDLDDINVGQQVRLFGTLSGTALDVSSASGVIRMQPTAIFGFAAGAASGGTLTIDLQRVGLRNQSAFTWANGGASPPNPLALTLQIGMLDQGLGITTATAIEARGYFPAVDDAGADFIASALVNRDHSPSLVLLCDHLGGMTVATVATSSSIVFDITGTAGLGEFAIVDQGFVGVLPLPTTPSPSVVPAGSTTLCLLKDKDAGTLVLYSHFDAFSSALASKLTFSGQLVLFGALGPYDAPTNALSSSVVIAVID